MKLKTIMIIILVLYTLGMLTIAILSSLSGVQGIEGKDKIIHFTEFFIFTLLLLTTLSITGTKNSYEWALLIVLILVIVSEAVQIPIIERSFSPADMMADMAGAASGFIVFLLGRFEWKRLKR